MDVCVVAAREASSDPMIVGLHALANVYDAAQDCAHTQRRCDVEQSIHTALRQRRDLLASYHERDLPYRQHIVLFLEAQGLDPAEIADVLVLSGSTVRNHLGIARPRVVPAPLAPSRGNATAWVWIHRDCCMAADLSRQASG